ncbi:MAG: hypothetical protein GWP05_10635, partial [Anaerolineaceae bacterium]|nr:hypothetical protein [Anaerolineaceae bacterium]
MKLHRIAATLLALGLLATTALAQDEAQGQQRRRRRRQLPPQVRKKILEKFDANGDGELSQEERQAARKALFEKIDTDGDGKLSDEERQAARQEFRQRMGERRKKMLEKFD